MVVFPRQLVCQRTLYFIQLRGFLVPTLLPGLIVIRSQLGPCLEASDLAHARGSHVQRSISLFIGCQSLATCSPRCPTCPVAICIYPEGNYPRTLRSSREIKLTVGISA